MLTRSREVWSVLLGAARSSFTPGEPAPVDYPFVASDIAMLHRQTPHAQEVDEQTWTDLLAPAWLARVGAGVSIFGQQWLYRALRRAAPASDMLWPDVAALSADAPERARLAAALRCLRATDTEVAERLFATDAPSRRAWWEPWYWLAPWLLLPAIAAAFWTPLAWLAVLALLFAMMSVHVGTHHTVTQGAREHHALQMLLRAKTLLDADAEAARLNRALAPSPLDAVPLAKDYREWFALTKVKHHLRCRDLVDGHRARLRSVFEEVARREAMLALACHVAGRTVCAAATGPLALRGVAHPLLAHALPATVTLHGKGLFVTGRNGEGKSTLLRTVGLNLLVGRALGFCYAEQASVPALPLYCSLQNEDSLLDGESLFISELRRGREMLDAGEGVFVIDEIFRGTNHVDSVAAAAALVEELSQRGIVLVSSHNVILGALLRHRLDAVCVSRAEAELVLAPGVLVETNALALLGEHGLGASVQASARRVAQWLHGYLASPAAAERVLASDQPEANGERSGTAVGPGYDADF